MKTYYIMPFILFTFLLTSCSQTIETTRIDENTQSATQDQLSTDTVTSSANVEKWEYYTYFTDNSTPVDIYPIGHATAIIEWGDTTIYIDPAEEVEKYAWHNTPDIILLTHVHGDHLSAEVLSEIYSSETQIIVPASVNVELDANLQEISNILENEQSTEVNGINLTAVPAYNIRTEALDFHPEERNDNGYILEQDWLRIYFSGDSEDTPEMRALQDIDVAFVSMNFPFTMTAESAASAVLEFTPTNIFPYHYRGRDEITDLDVFKNIVEAWNSDIKVMLHDWYE